jgi:RimJ/RimL family protein N-acetyltransferase
VWRISPENLRSRAAITRIGATLIGHQPEGLLVYTMRQAAWPAAKMRLAERLAKA